MQAGAAGRAPGLGLGRAGGGGDGTGPGGGGQRGPRAGLESLPEAAGPGEEVGTHGPVALGTPAPLVETMALEPPHQLRFGGESRWHAGAPRASTAGRGSTFLPVLRTQ